MDTAERQKDLERLRRLRPIDDDFMRCLFKDNIPLVELVLRIITGKPDLVITDCQTQVDMKRLGGARSLCLDATGTDSDGTKYDLEIQREDRGAEPHRARYHASVLDVENLDAGQPFDQLPETYVIFILERDFFKTGKPVYRIERMNLDTGRPFGDGEHILYVNGKYRGDSDLGRLMHDFSCTDAADMHFALLAERTRYLKEHPKGVSEMCKVIEDMRREEREAGIKEGMQKGIKEGMQQGIKEGMQQGIKEGIQKGIKEGMQQGIKESTKSTALRMLADGTLALEKIAEYAGLSLDEVRQLQAERHT